MFLSKTYVLNHSFYYILREFICQEQMQSYPEIKKIILRFRKMILKNIVLYYTIRYIVIQPNTFAIELSNMITMHTGARYFMKKQYILLRLNPEDCSTSCMILSSPAT